MTAAACQPTLFETVEQIDARYENFMKRGVIFWRRMGLKYGEHADWSIQFSPEKMMRVNGRSAELLHALGGLGSVW